MTLSCLTRGLQAPWNRIGKLVAGSRHFSHPAACAVLACFLCLVSSEPAWAKAKKKEVEEVETKSYVLPYLIVITMVSVGVMTVCRPSRRLDKAEEKVKKEEE